METREEEAENTSVTLPAAAFEDGFWHPLKVELECEHQNKI